MHEKKKLGKSSCQKAKVLAGILCKKAMVDDIINKNYAEAIEPHDEETQEREFFSDMEIRKIEELTKTHKWAKAILIMIYTGLRIGELVTLTKFSVDMDKQVITGGIKTEAGKNRVVPINPKILGCVNYWYETEGSYFINRDGEAIRDNYFRKYLYYPTLEKAEVRRLSPHSTRHTFASLLNRAGANTKAIQKLIGHADYSTTANIYTHTDIEELRKAITSI